MTSPQVIIYVDDANDEVPVFTQQQYNRLGLRETAGIGTSVIVVRATDPDTGKCPISNDPDEFFFKAFQHQMFSIEQEQQQKNQKLLS